MLKKKSAGFVFYFGLYDQQLSTFKPNRRQMIHLNVVTDVWKQLGNLE